MKIQDIDHSPMIVVDDVAVELEHLSSLCHILAFFQDNPARDTIALKDMSGAMALLRDRLDAQIKALNGIQWAPETVVSA